MVSKRQAEKGGGGGHWGGLFSLQFMNKRNYSEHTHPQPESSWSKAYFEFIWCAIHYLLKMKKNDFYCTELFYTHSHLLKCFLFKANYKKKKRKESKASKQRKRWKNEKGEELSKQKQPRATFSMHLAEWCLVSPMEVPMLPYTLCF